MLKIKYPKNRAEFESDYLRVFHQDKNDIEVAINSFIKDNGLSFNSSDDLISGFVVKNSGVTSVKIDKLLTASYKELLGFAKVFKTSTEEALKGIDNTQKIKNLKKTITSLKIDNVKSTKKTLTKQLQALEDPEKFLENELNYKGHQKYISNFFVDYSQVMSLATCYYCNLEYVNAINSHPLSALYKSVNDIVRNATKEELESIPEFGPKVIQTLLRKRKSNDLASYRPHEKILKVWRNQFELDHFLDKDSYPIVSLSLYNFVPSCHSCNARFKHTKQLKDNSLSPTCESFTFERDVLFSLKLKSSSNDFNISQLEDFLLYLDLWIREADYKDYMNIFKLEQRHDFHKQEVLNLINKKRKYSESQIVEISRITRKSMIDIKKDIFGKELFEGDLQEKPLTKLKRDIAKQIGIVGVKED